MCFYLCGAFGLTRRCFYCSLCCTGLLCNRLLNFSRGILRDSRFRGNGSLCFSSTQ